MIGFLALWGQRVRRDRVQLPIWILGAAALAAAADSGVSASYATEADRVSILALSLAHPVILLFRGLPSGPAEGAFIAFQIMPWLALLAALMSAFLAVRHTRADEELGRAELVAATAAGRAVPLAATIAHGLVANIALGGAWSHWPSSSRVCRCGDRSSPGLPRLPSASPSSAWACSPRNWWAAHGPRTRCR